MKITKQKLKTIILEEKLRAIVESEIPYTKKEFYSLIESLSYTTRTTGEPGTQVRDWWELMDKDTIAYGMLKRAAKEYDEAKAKKPLSMTKNEYLKSVLYKFRTAGHKLNYTDTVRMDDHPARYSRRSPEDVIRRGYPEEGLPSRKITTDRELNQALSDSDKTDELSKYWADESEAYISPFGYVHAKVADYQEGGRMIKNPDIWIYVGNYYPYKDKPHYKSKRYDPMDPTGEKIKPEIMGMEAQKLMSYAPYGWPRVTAETLKMEREIPSPDRDALWGKGEYGKGTVDVQEPSLEEGIVKAVMKNLRTMGI